MKSAFMFIAAGLIAGLFFYGIESAKAVEMMISSVVIPFAQRDILSAEGGLNVFTLLLISLGFVCFMKLRGQYNT